MHFAIAAVIHTSYYNSDYIIDTAGAQHAAFNPASLSSQGFADCLLSAIKTTHRHTRAHTHTHTHTYIIHHISYIDTNTRAPHR